MCFMRDLDIGQYVGNEEDVLKRNEVVRMKYGSMMKRYKMEDF